PVVVGHPDVAVVPQLVPRTLVTVEGLLEGAQTPDRLLGVGQGLVDRLVVRGVEREQLLDTDRSSLLEVEAQCLMGIVLHPIEPALDLQLTRVSVHARPYCLGHVDTGLTSLRYQGDGVRTRSPALYRMQVASLELPVAGDALVCDARVTRRE